MANFHDPILVLQDFLMMIKFWHALFGIFLWEFFTTLDFEWSVIRGRRPYRRTIWLYSLTRIITLTLVILNVVEFDVWASGSINCQTLVIVEFALSYFAVACASLLIVLRVVAIWNYNKIALGLATGVWGANLVFIIQGTVRLHSVRNRDPEESPCVVVDSDITKLNLIVTFVTVILLLLMMLVGLLRIRLGSGGMLNLVSFLWKQGIIELSLAVVAGVPPTVFLSLNLNEPFNLMFQMPALMSMTIAVTRTYRSLMQFSSDTVINLPNSGISFAKFDGVSDPGGIIPMHVVLPSSHEDTPLSQFFETYLRSQGSMDGQLRIELHNLGPEEA